MKCSVSSSIASSFLRLPVATEVDSAGETEEDDVEESEDDKDEDDDDEDEDNDDNDDTSFLFMAPVGLLAHLRS